MPPAGHRLQTFDSGGGSRPPRRRQSLERQNRIPPPPDPETWDWKGLLEEGLRGPVDPVIVKELEDLMWMQQKRVWGDEGGCSDPFFSHLSRISLLDIWPSNLEEGVTHAHQRETDKPGAIESSNDEGVGAFEEVLDLYRGAAEWSMLSMELEMTVGGNEVFMKANWENASALEVSGERGYSVEAQRAMTVLEGPEKPGLEIEY